MADLLVDTDIFIVHLRGAAPITPGRHRLHYSVVTRAELFAGNTATNLSSQLLAPFRELPIDRAIAERAGRAVREFGVRLPDALLAATRSSIECRSSVEVPSTSTRSEDFGLIAVTAANTSNWRAREPECSRS